MRRYMMLAAIVAAALLPAAPALADKAADARYILAHPEKNYSADQVAWAKSYLAPIAPAPVAAVEAPAPAPAARVVSGQTALLNLLSGAKGGETFALAPGGYSANISGIRKSPPVILIGQPGVKFSAGVIKNAAGLTFRGIRFAGSAGMAPGQAVVRLENSEAISFEDGEFDGVDHTGTAVFGRTADNRNIRIAGNSISDLSRGVVFYGGAGIRTEGNAFSGIGDDCIDYSNLTPYGAIRNTISRNTARNSFYNPGSHRDFAQLMANRGLDVVANDLWFDGQAINDFGSPKSNLDLNVIGNVVRMISYNNAIRFDLPGTTGAANDNQVTSGKVKATMRIPATMTKRGNTIDGKPY